tara:strand:- start:314 stop:913 length:600 start_codon:yes stop_codon:yes gene_type:complete
MELFVIRHTEVNNPDNLCYGNFDIPLKDNYKLKSKRLFLNLPENLDQIYSSPSKRCTDLLISQNKKFIKKKELQELNFGDWEGKKWDQIDQIELSFWMEDYVNRSPKNGEKMIDLFNRVISFTYSIYHLSLDKVLFVTHSGVIRAILSEALEIDLNDIFKIDVIHDEIYRFEIEFSEKAKIKFLDRKNIKTKQIRKQIV